VRREPPAETLSMERVWGNSAQFAAVGSSPRGEGGNRALEQAQMRRSGL
jgi:hypothetical protein